LIELAGREIKLPQPVGHFFVPPNTRTLLQIHKKPEARYALSGYHWKATNPLSLLFHILGKYKTFPLNQKLTCGEHGVAWYAINSSLAKQSTNFPRDGQRTEIRRKELDKRVYNDQMALALSWHYTVLQKKRLFMVLTLLLL